MSTATAWARNRDRLLAGYRHGRRPMAWWQFEAGDLRYPGYDREQSTLYRAGLLGEEERAELAGILARGVRESVGARFLDGLAPELHPRGRASEEGAHSLGGYSARVGAGMDGATSAPGANHWQAGEGGH